MESLLCQMKTRRVKTRSVKTRSVKTRRHRPSMPGSEAEVRTGFPPPRPAIESIDKNGYNLSMLLIHPPLTKPCEPPAGIARLAGFLKDRGARVRTVDLNIEAILHLLEGPSYASDTFARRAEARRELNIRLLRSFEAYGNQASYTLAVRELEKKLKDSVPSRSVVLSLTDYRNAGLSPLRSEDLYASFEHPEGDPFYPYFSRRLDQFLEEDDERTAGLSVSFQSQALTACAVAGFLKRRGLTIIAGGGLITSWIKNSGNPDILPGIFDKTVAGPGEEFLAVYLGLAEEEQEASPSLPCAIPDYSGLRGLGYLAPGGGILPYAASSGCMYRKCRFCPETAEQNPYLPVRRARIEKDISSLTADWKPALIHFLDSEISPRVLTGLAENPPGFPWYGFVRPSEELADPGFAERLKRSGCLMLKLGLESGNDRVLEGLAKGITTGLSSRVLRSLKAAGIGTFIYLLFGCPEEGESEAEDTLEFTAKNSPFIDYLNLAIFNLPRKSGYMETLSTSEFYEGDLSLYAEFKHPAGWDRAKVRAFLGARFKRHPAILPILGRSPQCFGSNHAAFFLMDKKTGS